MRYRAPWTFDSVDEFNDYYDDEADRYEAEAQAADDYCSERDE